MSKPSLAVVIVSYNVRADLERCLTSVASATIDWPTTTVVVDNKSQDGTLAWLRSAWPSVVAIDAGDNLGFARATNLGIRATTSDLVLLLNPDTVVEARAITGLVDALHAVDDAAAVGPRLVDGDGQPELSFGPMISVWGELIQARLVRAYERRTGWAVERVERLTGEPGPRDWVSGACLLAWRADLDAVGLLDERYFLYAEDVDLCAALRSRGRTVHFVPGVTVQHLRGRAAATAPSATARHRRASQLAFYRKHHPRWAPFVAWWIALRDETQPAPDRLK